MIRQRIRRRSGRARAMAIALVAGVACLASREAGAVQLGYYIDEMTNYQNGNSCDIVDVNTITASLQTQLNSDGWTGDRYTEFSAWPQDYWESCSSGYGTNGVDSLYGDAFMLTVFAGHGNDSLLAYSNTGNGGTYGGNPSCFVDFPNNTRLGEMSGAIGGVGIWLACEVIQSSELGSNYWQSLHQEFGWQNSIGIGNDEPLDFYMGTNTQTNANAWLNQMSSGGRNAIAVSFSLTSLSDCWSYHDSAKLRGAVGSDINNGATCGGGQPLYYYCYQTEQGS